MNGFSLKFREKLVSFMYGFGSTASRNWRSLTSEDWIAAGALIALNHAD
jgi:hypothetical protein